MRHLVATALGLLLVAPAGAAAQVTQVQLTYDTYAAGIEVMQMRAFFGLGPWNYHVAVDYHTTGLVGLFYRGHQVNAANGVWDEGHVHPQEFSGDGVWRGVHRVTLIDYNRGIPEVKQLVPPQSTEREPVPDELQRNTMDTLSALAQLIHNVELTRSCDTTVHTYDGRRVLEIVAHTGGMQTLEPTSRSSFSGATLRCDFQGREIAGFLIGEDDPEHRRPLDGSAWLAPLSPKSAPLPARIAFQTRWFGPATMYLTSTAPTAGAASAR
jgi:hypothetical protein